MTTLPNGVKIEAGNIITGTSKSDRLYLDYYVDYLSPESKSITVFCQSGDDQVDGGNIFTNGAGLFPAGTLLTARFFGNEGNDTFVGRLGTTEAFGGSGRDVFLAGGAPFITLRMRWWISGDTVVLEQENTRYIIHNDVELIKDFGGNYLLVGDLLQGVVRYLTSEDIRNRVNEAPKGIPIISGTLRPGSTLAIDSSLIQDNDNFVGYTPAFQYHWETSPDGTNWTELTGTDATDNNSTYTLVDADADKIIRARVTFVDGYGTEEVVWSEPSRLITSTNQAPSDIILSASVISEKLPAGSVVAVLATTDPNVGDAFTYSLVPGLASKDNNVFSVQGNELRINNSPDFEAKSDYNIRLRSVDSGGLSFEKAFSLNVLNVNEVPTNITLSATSIAENSPAGSVIGSFNTTDPDASDTFSYSLVTGSGSSDNSSFRINGNQLEINVSPDFEQRSSYSIRVRTSDQGGLIFDRPLNINITDMVEMAKPDISVVGTDLITGEDGKAAQFSYVLRSQPTDLVTLNFSLSDTTEASLNTPAIIFTPSTWNIPQVLTVTGLDDYLNDGDVSYFISTSITSPDPNYGQRRDGTGAVAFANLVLTNRDDGLEKDLTLYGDNGGNTVVNDLLKGINGKDRIYGLLGRDRLKGGRNDDRIYGGVDDDTLWGEDGNDDLYGEQDDDTLYGGEGDDRLTGGEGTDLLVGGTGNDTYVLDDSFDTIDDQGTSTDIDKVIIRGNLTTYALPKGIEAATLEGTSGIELTGNSGNNQLIGNANANRLVGGDGNDELYAGDGDDSCDGGGGDDLLVGGDGRGNDMYDGGAGIDTVKYSSVDLNPVSVNLTTGKAVGKAIGSDMLRGIENVIGGSKNDIIIGSTAANRFIGGIGADQLTGGKGRDVFTYQTIAESTAVTSGRDIITDFDGKGGDTIDLTAIDANLGQTGNQAFTFIGTKAFTGKSGELRFAGGLLTADVNGDRKTDFSIALSKVTSLNASMISL